MATHDRPQQPCLSPQLREVSAATDTRTHTQHELFARLALRPLPVMKGEPEEFWVLPDPNQSRTLH